MTSLLEAVGRIVTAHVSKRTMTAEEVVAEIMNVHATLSNLRNGLDTERGTYQGAMPAVPRDQAFKKSEVVCMLCGKGGLRTLTRHLKVAHSMKPGQYRKSFGIPKKQPLTAGDFSAQRRAMTLSRGLADNLVKARAVRGEKIKARKASDQNVS